MEQIFADNVKDIVAQIPARERFLLAIDGRPCSGKSTLADQIIDATHAQAIFLDDFFVPREEWPRDITPIFPFPFFRNRDFEHGIYRLSCGQPFSYRPYDWGRKALAEERTVVASGLIIVEGVSVLRNNLAPSYDARIFVVSDIDTEFDAIAKREKPEDLATWQSLYLPSVDHYMHTLPWLRAEILYAGRGVSKDQIFAKLA